MPFKNRISQKMGVKSEFRKNLKNDCPLAFQIVDKRIFVGQCVAVDCLALVYRFAAKYERLWIYPVVEFLNSLRAKKIFLVIDGETPQEKADELKRRKTAKEQVLKTLEQNVNELEIIRVEYGPASPQAINLESRIEKIKYSLYRPDFEEILKLKQQLNPDYVEWVTAPGEGETECARLVKSGQCDYVLSNDSDLILCMCPNIVLFSKNGLELINCQIILDQLEFTADQLLEFGILCGTDFNANLKDHGYKKNKKLIQQYGCIEHMLEETKLKANIHEFVQKCDYQKIKTLFKI